MVIYPFAYNPVTKTLRVYFDITVEMYADGAPGENTMTRKSSTMKMDPEINAMYENHFINYAETNAKYTPVNETGELLIICHDAFMSAMQPFVNWKKQIGRPTTMVGTSTAGNTDSAIKAYIQSQYDANNNLSHVLLVGDVAQIPGHSQSGGGYSGKSDNWYGQVAGNDYYNDIIVGRFSAEEVAHVTTQVNKVIHYERDLNATDTWLPIGQGVSKNEGAGNGHYGEADYQHIDNIRNDLLAYNYTEVHRDYQGVTGVTSSAAIISQHINEGVSIINYCNHGSATSWGVFSYSNSNINALTNVHKLPIIWSVACDNGKYDYSQPCFGETWLRANNSNNPEQPTGAIGGMFSYISQPWHPPMYGHDEMVDVLVESNSSNIKRTLGGCSYDGNMKILDQYGQGMGQGWATYFFWILFGDPTLTLRNAVPADMNVTHAPSMNTSATSFMVNAPNGNGALATLTMNNEILGSATINNGSCNITFTAPGQPGEATLTLFGYNKVTYVGTVSVTSGGTSTITLNVMANPAIIALGESTQLNANASGGNGTFTYSWSPSTGLSNPNIASPTATPTTTTNYTCTVSSAGQTQTSGCKVTVVCPPNNLTATVNEQDVQLQWTAPSEAESYKVYRNGTMIAQNVTETNYADRNLPNGTYNYYVVTCYQNVTSPNSSTTSATVNASIAVAATANPALIPLGESSNLSAAVTGGSGTITYSWTPAASLNNPNIMSPVATPTETTTYTVTATRNGLTNTDQVTVQVVTPPTNVNVTSMENTDEVVLVTWTAPSLATTYNVFDNGELVGEGVSGTQAEVSVNTGEHCFTVTAVYQGVESPASDPACIEIFICRPPESLEATYYWEDHHFGVRLVWTKNEEANLSLNQFLIYRGTDPENMTQIATLANVPFTYLYEYLDEDVEPNEYYYLVVADFGDHGTCQSEPVMVTVTSVDENGQEAKVYPSPTAGELHIEGAGLRQVQVFNALGQRVYATMMEGESLVIDLSTFGKGVYMIRLTDAQGQTTVRKTVVK